MEKLTEDTKALHFDVPAGLHKTIKTKMVREGVKIKFVGAELFKYWVKNGLPE